MPTRETMVSGWCFRVLMKYDEGTVPIKQVNRMLFSVFRFLVIF